MPRQSALFPLEQVLKGKTVFEAHNWDYLREMSQITAEYVTREHSPVTADHKPLSAEFYLRASEAELTNRILTKPVFPFETGIVGNTYRSSHQQSALRNKNQGNRCLIVPEPGNPHDKAAMAVLVAKSLSSQSFVWTHVGYVPRAQAAQLASVWPRYKGRLLVGEGRIIGTPAKDTNPAILIEPSFRDYWSK